MIILAAALAALVCGAAARDAPTAPAAAADVQALLERWPGVYDSSEQLVLGGEPEPALRPTAAEARVRTLVRRVSVPFLGAHTLYLEEFPHDDPQDVRRQVILRLEPRAGGRGGVHVRQFTFRDPQRWRALPRDAQLAQRLSADDLEAIPGCDLWVTREGDQFRGSTAGRECRDAAQRYVEYRFVLGEDLYWYRKRIVRASDDVPEQEVVGFNWFELSDARLFTCRVRQGGGPSEDASGRLARLDLHDKGGRGRFTTHDGRRFELQLHSQNWPFAINRDALILMLTPVGQDRPLAAAFAELDAPRIGLEAAGLRIECVPVVPESGELQAFAPAAGVRGVRIPGVSGRLQVPFGPPA